MLTEDAEQGSGAAAVSRRRELVWAGQGKARQAGLDPQSEHPAITNELLQHPPRYPELTRQRRIARWYDLSTVNIHCDTIMRALANQM